MTFLRFVLITVVCVSITSVGIIFAQDDAAKGGTVRGKITDTTAAQNPIEGVKVEIVAQDGSKEFTAKTDADGNYERSGLPEGRYLINIYRRDYVGRIGKPVTVVNGGDHFVRLRMSKKNYSDTQRIEGFLQHISENVGRRYNLSTLVVDALHQSIYNSIESALMRGEDILSFGEAERNGTIVWLETLLSHPNCRAIFAKYLTETQLQDYLNFTKARRQRDHKAAVQFLTVFLDQMLNLTANQRKNVTQLLFDRRGDEQRLTSINLLEGQSLRHGIVNLLNDKSSLALDKVLNQDQFKIWQSIVNIEKAKWSNKVGVEVLEPKKPKARGIDGGEIDVGLDELEKQSQDESEEDITESQTWQLAEAILATHTERLGPLNALASQRLIVVTKGVVQQYFEAQAKVEGYDFEVMRALAKLIEAVNNDETTYEEAVKKLNTMQEELWDQRDANIRSGKATIYDIIDHPLYQQAIKDVLSEEAFERYLARRREREALGQQALCDLAVSLIDIQLLLDDRQRNQLETTALQLTIGPLSDGGFSIVLVELLLRTDPEMWSTWQRAEWER